ncbi:helix-turn-helix transcriptional regulator [Paenibacillus sp. CGMCC 1.16610]|uniref:Helix-turn-helix domain-containing protein n=1 Tax=Paenibacillus anseongense TaxID=2682845 RepID=A0ABW9UIU2_9BACL|nr:MULTISPECIES: helix-turn-helix transcriptional regulator [Paenibacillus]MBA2943911.1 helix-turn-helix transcriptional regulator [Paenibacillus sp. CGMCC 1.16610]MVQ37800.1 helix-turn-helix domain-containing protein [Paenibacillus anseongense]
MKQLEGFGKFLESLRGKMSLREAANKSGLSHAYIRDLELERNRSTNEKINPSPVTLKKLSDAYNIPYTDLMEKAGYLENESEQASSKEALQEPVSMNDTLFIEVSSKEMIYHTRFERISQAVNSLLDFSLFLDKLEEMGFKKMDTDLFVNMNHVQKYIEKEGKLYFDTLGISKFVVIAAIRQKKYHDLIIRSVARNTGMGLEFHYERPSAADSLLSSVKRPI